MTVKKVLVTGSSGTIGTRLCEKLLASGYEVVGADYQPNKWNKEINDITIDLDLRDKDKVLSSLPTDVDAIVHLAANARVYNLVVEPDLALDNMKTVFNVLEFARLNKTKRFLFASSREAYGNSEKMIHKEDEVEIDLCESPYTASKIAGESLVWAYQRCYDIDTVIFRFSNVYGMYDDSDRVVPLFIRQCKADQDSVVFGREKELDFTYIDDSVGGIIKTIEKFDSVKNDVYNLAYGEGTTILSVAEMIKSKLGSSNNISISDNRTGEVVKYVADITKARNKIGFNPKTTIEDGIKKSIEWYAKHG